MVLATQTAMRQRPAKDPIIDCDIHNAPSSDTDLSKYLSPRWRRHHEIFGLRGHFGDYYPQANLNAARVDAWSPSGLPPGSDLAFLQEQLLDHWNIEYGILNPLLYVAGQLNLEYGAALSSAFNEWLADAWLDREPRLRASMKVPYEDGELAAAEIDRVAPDRRFVQALVIARTAEPLGRRKYWKMYEALARHDLPLGIHFGGSGGHPITAVGWPSYYLEDHAGMSVTFQYQVISLICEGVFEHFPTLKVVLIEGGSAWLPSLMWRLDHAYRRLKDEVPHLKRLPSEYIREHFWITTQPIEEPHRPRQFLEFLDHLDMNARLLFATDYPHWDFDAPDLALPPLIKPDLRRAILRDNAHALYRFS